jgi:hypothetical protein
VQALVLHGQLHRLFVVDPAGVHRSHVDEAGDVVLRACAGHHVECSLGHVGVRMVLALVPVEFALHGTDIHDELPSFGVAFHAFLEPGVNERRRHSVDRENFRHFVSRHLVQAQHPAVFSPEVHLLPIDVHGALGEQQRVVNFITSDDDSLRSERTVDHTRGFED